MAAGSVTCALFGRSTAGVNADRIRRDWDFEWRRSTANGDSRFSVDIPLPAGPVDLGLALDGIAHRDQPVLRALSRETAVDLDIAIWFESSNEHPLVLAGDWLSACGRTFDIWAEVSHAEGDADIAVSSSTDVVTVAWHGDGRARQSRIVEASAEQRQRRLMEAVHRAISEDANQVHIDLSARSGIAGIVIPADLVAALASRRVTVALRGERRQADRDRLVSA